MARRSILASVFGALFLFAAQPAQADDVSKVLIKQADKMFNKRGKKKTKDDPNPERTWAQDAKEKFLEVLAVAPKNVEARWKASRALYWIGRHTKGNDAKMKIFEEGIRFAQEGIKLDPKNFHCHFWLGVSYGKFGEAKGIAQSLGLVPHVEKAMKKVIELGQEKYEQGGAWRVLGRLSFKVPGGENGKKEIQKAIEIGPNNLMNHRFYAEMLLSDGDDAKAKTELEFIIRADRKTFPKGRFPDMMEEKARAKRLWKKQGWAKIW